LHNLIVDVISKIVWKLYRYWITYYHGAEGGSVSGVSQIWRLANLPGMARCAQQLLGKISVDTDTTGFETQHAAYTTSRVLVHRCGNACNLWHEELDCVHCHVHMRDHTQDTGIEHTKLLMRMRMRTEPCTVVL